MTQRREVRETVLQALYAEDISRDPANHVIRTYLQPMLKKDKESFQFAKNLFLKTVENQEEIDAIIEEHIRNWKMSRLAIIDRLILRMALSEFLYFEEIPIKVTINEAIEIAKRFSTHKSGKFVNGILDAALDKLQEDNRIIKKGRGLVESS